MFLLSTCGHFSVFLLVSERERLLLRGSRLPSEQLKLSSSRPPSILLSSSVHRGTAATPRPSLPPTDGSRQSRALTWSSPPCALKRQTHTGQAEVLRLRFHAVTLSASVCSRGPGGDEQLPLSPQSLCCVRVFVLLQYHFTTCPDETCVALRLQPRVSFLRWTDVGSLQLCT